MLCKKIKNLRIKRGFTQNQIAELYGATPTNIYQLENGKRAISIEALQKLSIILEFTFLIKDGEITLKENTDNMENLIHIVKNELKNNTSNYEFLLYDEMEFRIAKSYNMHDQLIYNLSLNGEIERSIYIVPARAPGKRNNYKITLEPYVFKSDKLDWGTNKFEEHNEFKEIFESLKGECIAANKSNIYNDDIYETSYENVETAVVAAIKTLKLLINKKVEINNFGAIINDWEEIYHVVLRDRYEFNYLYRDVAPSISEAMEIIKATIGPSRKRWFNYFGKSLIGYPGEVYKNNLLVGKFELDDETREIIFKRV